MTDLFLDVLNTSFAATWVVLAVVLVRPFLKKAPRWMVCGLWALVAARLLIGGGITAPFSMIPSAEVIPPQSLYDQAPVIHSGIPIVDNTINPVYTESLRANPVASVNPLQIWTAVFANIWILGMAALGIWALISWFRVRRQVRESIPTEDGVFLCDRIASPFIFGLFRPKIYLPSDLSDYARGHVIAHELAHLRRRDHWWKPLGFALLTVNWFNPAMWLAYILLCRDIEMACDEKVVREFSLEEKKAYSTALLRCSVNSRRITACPLAFGEVGVKARIKSVLNYKKPAFWVVLITLVVSTVLAVGLLTSPEPGAEDPWCLLTLKQGTLYGNEELTGAAADALHELLRELPNQQVTPAPALTWNQYSDDSDASFTIIPEDQTGNSYGLFRTAEHGWVGFCREPESGDSAWYFDGSGLDRFLASYEAELQQAGTCFSPSEGATLSLEFQTVIKDGLQLRAGIPCLEQGESHIHWEYEPLKDEIGFRCRPIGKKDWMEVRFHDYTQWLDHYTSDNEPITLQNGASGTLYHWDDTARWSEITLYTTKGLLHIKAPNKELTITDWKKDDYRMALAIVGTMRMTENGTSLFGITNPLGITLEIEEVSPNGATVVASHNDTYQHDTHWDEIKTWPSWSIQEYRDGTWVDLLPEDITWSVEFDPVPIGGSRSYNLNWSQMIGILGPGRYRIAMTFAGCVQFEPNQSPKGCIIQTCYMEFDMNSLGISLHLENITPDGATLVCTQDGTIWQQIITGIDWNLERYENGEWVSLMPESMFWTTEAYPIPIGGSRSFGINWNRIVGALEPGQYRIAKTFQAYPVPGGTKSTTQGVTQTCYAVFEVNPLGITLHMENITPGGGTLVCTQDGTGWEHITTGSDWTLEQFTADGWVSILPESTTWNDMAYLINQSDTTSWYLDWSKTVGELEPGFYRVGKTFTGMGKFKIDGTCATGEMQRQTCYTEFLIDSPAIQTQPEISFSPALIQAVKDDWIAYEALSPEARSASSKTPGYCAREFDNWAEVVEFVGMEVANPLEGLQTLEKGNWAAAPVGYNGGSRFYVSFSGTREGHVQQVTINSGYRRDGMRVGVKAEIYSDSPSSTPSGVITEDSGDAYEARTASLIRDPIQYTIRVMGELGTGDELMALLQELLPYFDEMP